MLRKYQRPVALITVVLAALLIAACSSGGDAAADNTVAASVNSRKIMSSEVERVIQQQMQGKQSELSAHDLAQARLTVLEKLIQREVLYQRAEQEKLLPTEEQITTAINQRKQEAGVTQEEFDRQLKESGMNNEGLREEAKKDLAVNSLQDKYAGKITISDREVEDYYNANKPQFVNARGVSLAVIIIDPADNSAQGITNDAKSETEAKAKIDDIYQQLKSGPTDFATLARAKSEDQQSLLRGGDIGFFSEDGMKQAGLPKELIDTFMGPMAVGGITEPKLVNNRWYIFKLQERRLQTENLTLESQFPNGDSVRHQITVALTNQRKEILNAALLTVAMTEAKVVNNLATNILTNPSNLGLRPASSAPAKTASSPAAAAGPSAAPKATSSPAKAASPAK